MACLRHPLTNQRCGYVLLSTHPAPTLTRVHVLLHPSRPRRHGTRLHRFNLSAAPRPRASSHNLHILNPYKSLPPTADTSHHQTRAIRSLPPALFARLPFPLSRDRQHSACLLPTMFRAAAAGPYDEAVGTSHAPRPRFCGAVLLLLPVEMYSL